NTSLLCSLYLLQLLPPPTATLFPYTTLFRSKPPATAPNRDAGILNQLLLMNELTPPWAVITSEGYMLARAWRVCASAIRTLNSAARTSGLLLSRAAGTPADTVVDILI